MKKKIGLLMGSFNPPHAGHILSALDLVKEEKVNEVWLVPTPQNPFKEVAVNVEIRSIMLKNITNGLKAIRSIFINEMELSSLVDEDGKYYSYKQLDYLESIDDTIRKNEVCIVTGPDVDISTWKNSEYILKKYNQLIISRDVYKLSSTLVRDYIMNKDRDELKLLSYLGCVSNLELIKENKLYGYEKLH